MAATIFDYLPEHAEKLLKTAFGPTTAAEPAPSAMPKVPGKMETKLPWYGVTAGTIGGAALGNAVVPQKYKALGQLGGALLGTAVGLEGGERLGRRLDKTAQLPEPPPDFGEPPREHGDNELPAHPALHALKTVGAGALGTGAGMLAGYGAGALAGKLTGKSIPSSTMRAAGPVLGGAAGLAYTIYKQHELEELQRALKSHQNQSSGRPPG